MQENKVVILLKSRKFWASLLSLAVSMGVFTMTDAQQSEIVDAIMVLVPAIIGAAYVAGTAIEDAGRDKNV